MSSFSPQVFIIGSQKCGTTSLARLLDDNPAICLSNPKEPNYYSGNYEKGIEWYRSCFSDFSKVLVDASTTYSMCALSDKALQLRSGRVKQTGVPERIYRDRPDAKIIYIIRNPVARLYSNYWHNKKYGYEKASLQSAILRDPQYIHLGQYYGQLEKYLEFFAKQNILVIKFEDFIREQQLVTNLCEEFIGVPKSTIKVAKKENSSKQYPKITQLLMNNTLFSRMERYIPNRIRTHLKNLLTKEIPALPNEEAMQISRLFVDDQEKLIATFGIGYTEIL